MNLITIMIAAMVASFIIQTTLESRFRKYSKIRTPHELSGADIARRMLDDCGIVNVRVNCIKGNLSDHYNPTRKTLNLSDSVYSRHSIAAAAVAAHECGHAVQDAYGYGPLKLRSALVPIVSFANRWVQWVLLAGLFLFRVSPHLLWLGIFLFGISTLFSLITLPVEINASSRAIAWLEKEGIVDERTRPMAADALRWAAFTYVIAAIGSLATLFYYIGIANSHRR